MIWTALLLLFLVSGPAQATIYQCRDAKGNLFLTDDLENFPPGCQAEEVQILRKETSVPPGKKAEPQPPPGNRETPPPPPGAASGTQASPVAQWRTEARQLTRSYQQAEARTSPNLPPETVQQAEDRLQQLRQRIEDFRDRLAQSSLTPEEQDAVEQELAPIESAVETPPGTPVETPPGAPVETPPGAPVETPPGSPPGAPVGTPAGR